ncbi:carbon-nitrogen hydrolase family protein [Martelella sp. UBA3392]|uniref:carbon-nitrogen hydrolase family protein n=1 Tax=Martelella sp. UBA3392 TaxID=1946834 RepID=UPI0039C8EE7C
MSVLRAGLIQTCAGDVPAENLAQTSALIREAAAEGAQLCLTPEVTNIVTFSRRLQAEILRTEDEDPSLAAYRELAAELGRWLLIGSLALKAEDDPGQARPRFVNRSFLIDASGGIVARYDKIHMFDVDLDNGESWRESAVYRPGDKAVLARLPFAAIGLGICYDVRFPDLYNAYGLAGAEVLTAPAAFTKQTGLAHWHVLQRARAIENGAYMISAAQAGTHEDGRETFGHSMIVDPWGKIIAEAGDEGEAAIIAEIDTDAVTAARGKVPNLKNIRAFALEEARALTEV